MEMVFDRAYYEVKLQQNLQLAETALMPSIREAHLRLADFYRQVLDGDDREDLTLSAAVNG